MKSFNIYLLAGASLMGLQGCVKDFVPSEKAAFSMDMAFTETELRPILGRNYNRVFFNDDLSTRPLTFKIVNMRTFDGNPAPELLKPFPVEVWKASYTGLETSIEEINAKRETVNRPLWDIGLHSGAFTMWNVASSDFVRTEPDSCYVFDVEVSNSGGKRYFRDFKLKPQKEIPAEVAFVEMMNVVGEVKREPNLATNFWLNRTGDGNTITFKFLDPQLKPIKLSKFNGMTTEDWKHLVHGFNPRFAPDSSSVTYDVAYPIPLVATARTRYNDGGNAISSFKYNRVAFGGTRISSHIDVRYAVYQKGDWEIVFYFPEEAPLFDND